MAQGKLKKITSGEYATTVIIGGFDGKDKCYIYNGSEDISKLLDCQVSFNVDNKGEGTQIDTFCKAWDKEGRVIYSAVTFDGYDRGDCLGMIDER